MSTLPQTARLYILLLIALAVGAVLFSVFHLTNILESGTAVLIVALGIALLDTTPVLLFGAKVETTLSGAVKVAAILIYPPPVAILGIFVGTLIGELPAKRPWFKKAFNISQLTISAGIAAAVFGVLHTPRVDYFGSLQNLVAFLLAGFAPLFTSWVLVSLVVNLVSSTPLNYVLTQNARQVGWYELSNPVLGAILAILWQYNPISILLIGLLFLLMRHSYQVAVQLQKQTHDALRALMQVIDVRDHHTFDHSERVSKYAQLMGEELGLSQEEVEVLAEAGLLHDLGKVGMVDDVLYKNGALNPKERKHAQEHAEVGSMLLSKFPLFEKGSLLVRHHHERYDGKGYPEGLAGEQIPLGSRIISVADAYQAMTENRPYRPALTQEAAIAQLQAGSGTQFDPHVVDVFIKILRSKRIT